MSANKQNRGKGGKGGQDRPRSQHANADTKVISQELDRALDKANHRTSERPLHECFDAVAIDGVPEHVAERCMEEAAKSFPLLDRRCDRNRKARQDDYLRRVNKWIAKREKDAARAIAKARKAADDAAIVQAVAESVLPKQELIEEIKQLVTPVDDWEELLAAEKSADITHFCRDLTISDKPKFEAEVPHGHPMLAKSREFADKFLRGMGMREMIKRQQQGATRPVVFDIGSGATGVKRAFKMLSTYAGADSIYWHCTFPIEGGDLQRDFQLIGASIGTTNLVDHCNFIEETGFPQLGVVNVCRHRAAECDCLRHYTSNFCFSIHSSYYFTDLDWHQLFRYTQRVHIAVHLPERFGTGFPAVSPEFQWVRPADAKTLSFWDKMRAVARGWITGVEQVVLEPLRPHGSTYFQPNPKEDIERGGFQMSGCRPALVAVDSFARNPLATVTRSAVCGTLAVLFGTAPSIQHWFGAVFLTLAATLPFLWSRALRRFRTSTEPLPGTAYTVAITDGRNLTIHGENGVQLYTYRRCPTPTKLLPRSVDSYAVHDALAGQLASTMSLAKDETKATAVAIARCLREGLSTLETTQTVQRAVVIYKEVKNGLAPKHILSTTHLVNVVQWCVWGLAVFLISWLCWHPALHRGYIFTRVQACVLKATGQLQLITGSVTAPPIFQKISWTYLQPIRRWVGVMFRKVEDIYWVLLLESEWSLVIVRQWFATHSLSDIWHHLVTLLVNTLPITCTISEPTSTPVS
jgi:hypothetical protein